MILKKATSLWKYTVILLIICIGCIPILISLIHANSVNSLSLNYIPKPTELISTTSKQNAALLRGIKLDPNNPFKIEFIFDKGSSPLNKKEQKKTLDRLLSYFCAALTLPSENLWVNLSPYEADRIMNDNVAVTELGRDLLGLDYILKQLSSSLTHPDTPSGKSYWNMKNQNAKFDSFNKIWIIPESADLYVDKNKAIIGETKLKVVSEKDYLAQKLNNTKKINSKNLAIDSIVPSISKEINTGRHFSRLRQIHHALILASWFKAKVNGSFYQKHYINKEKIGNITLSDSQIKTKIYSMYVDSFQKGVYKLSKKVSDSSKKRRSYFSGGIELDTAASSINVKHEFSDILSKLQQSGRDFESIIVKAKPISSALSSDLEFDRRISKDAKELYDFIMNYFDESDAEGKDTLEKWSKKIEEFQFLNKDFMREDFLVQAQKKKFDLDAELDDKRKDLMQLKLTKLRSVAMKKRLETKNRLINENKISVNITGFVSHDVSVFEQMRTSPFMEIFKEVNKLGGWKLLHELAHENMLSKTLRRVLHYARRQFVIAVLREAYLRVTNGETVPENKDFLGDSGSDNWVFSDLDISVKGPFGNIVLMKYYQIIEELFDEKVFTADLFDSNMYSGFIGLNKMIVNENDIKDYTKILHRHEEQAAFISLIMSGEKNAAKDKYNETIGTLKDLLLSNNNIDLSNYYIELMDNAYRKFASPDSALKRSLYDKNFRKDQHIEKLNEMINYCYKHNITRSEEGFFLFLNEDIFEGYIKRVIELKQMEVDAYHTPSAINATVNNKQIAKNKKSHPEFNDFVRLNYSHGLLFSSIEQLGKIIKHSNPPEELKETPVKTFLHINKYLDRIIQDSMQLINYSELKEFFATIFYIRRNIRSANDFETKFTDENKIALSRLADKAEISIKKSIKGNNANSANKEYSVLYKEIASIQKELNSLISKNGDKFINQLDGINNFISKVCVLLNNQNSFLLKGIVDRLKLNSGSDLVRVVNTLSNSHKNNSKRMFEHLRILRSIKFTMQSKELVYERRTSDVTNFIMRVLNKQMRYSANILTFKIMETLFDKDKLNESFNIENHFSTNAVSSSITRKNSNYGGIDFSHANNKELLYTSISPINFNYSFSEQQAPEVNDFIFEIAYSNKVAIAEF